MNRFFVRTQHNEERSRKARAGAQARLPAAGFSMSPVARLAILWRGAVIYHRVDASVLVLTLGAMFRHILCSQSRNSSFCSLGGNCPRSPWGRHPGEDCWPAPMPVPSYSRRGLVQWREVIPTTFATAWLGRAACRGQVQ
jgi:hypothetical protein